MRCLLAPPCPGQRARSSSPSPKVYIDLIQSYTNAGEFSSCFTELQRDFIEPRPTKLKSLIRLVKHWYQQVRPGSLVQGGWQRLLKGHGAGWDLVMPPYMDRPLFLRTPSAARCPKGEAPCPHSTAWSS